MPTVPDAFKTGKENHTISRQKPAFGRAVHLGWLLQQVASGVLLTLGLVMLASQVLRVSQGASDFCQDYIAAQRLAQGIPPYLPLHLWPAYASCPLPLDYDAHPPFTVLLFLPFGLLPRAPAFLTWGFCSLIAYLMSGLLLLRELGWYSLRGMALFVGASLLWQPLGAAETEQNLGQFLTLLLVVAWIVERRQHERWAGGLLGLAGLIKIWPASLLLYAFLRRRWQTGMMGSLVLFLGSGAALLALGANAYATYLGPAQAGERLAVPTIGNLSLVGVVVQVLSSTADATYAWSPAPWALSLEEAVLIGECAAGLALLLMLAWLWHSRQRLQSEAGALLGEGLLITTLLLAFPLTWQWGLLTLLLPLAMTLLALRRLPKPPRWWYALLLVSLALLARPLSLQGLIGWLLDQLQGRLAWWEVPLFNLPTYGLVLFAWCQGRLLGWLPPEPALQKASGKAPAIHPGDEPPFLRVRGNRETFRTVSHERLTLGRKPDRT